MATFTALFETSASVDGCIDKPSKPSVTSLAALRRDRARSGYSTCPIYLLCCRGGLFCASVDDEGWLVKDGAEVLRVAFPSAYVPHSIMQCDVTGMYGSSVKAIMSAIDTHCFSS